jgi:hypothetical protein
MGDNPSNRQVRLDITPNSALVSGTLQVPNRNILTVPAGALQGKIVQHTDGCLYHSTLKTPGGYIWQKLDNSIMFLRVGPSSDANFATIAEAISFGLEQAPALYIALESGNTFTFDGIDLDGGWGSVTQELRFIVLDSPDNIGCPFFHNSELSTFSVEPNEAAGVITLGLSGGDTTVTVTGSSQSPNFSADGVLVGDIVCAVDGSNTVTSHTITAVGTTSLTVTPAFPASLATTGNGFYIKPRVTVTSSSNMPVFSNGHAVLAIFSVTLDFGLTRELNIGGKSNGEGSHLSLLLNNVDMQGNVAIQEHAVGDLSCSIIRSTSGTQLRINKDGNVLSSNLGIIQQDTSSGEIISCFGCRAQMDALMVISMNRNIISDNSSAFNVEQLTAWTKGTGGSGFGFIEVRRASTFTGTVNEIRQINDFAFDHNMITITGSSISLSVGTHVAQAGCSGVLRARSMGATHVDNCVIDIIGGTPRDLCRADDFGDVFVATCSTTTGGDLVAGGMFGGATDTTVIGAGAISGFAVGELGAGGPASARVGGI